MSELTRGTLGPEQEEIMRQAVTDASVDMLRACGLPVASIAAGRLIALSEHDRLALHDFVPVDCTFASPFPIPADVSLAANPAPEWNGRFVFIGSEEHGPNKDALVWLLDEIWPRIASKITNARLIVIGRWNVSWRQRCAGPMVEFLGFVERLAGVLHGSIMLVPLRIGSGIRTKIVVALAQGVPVVSTTIGCEGLPLSNEVNALIQDDAGSFADVAVRLACNPALRRALAARGLMLAARDFAPEQVRRRRNEIYAAVVASHCVPRTGT